jgi:hypothetical protein
MEEGAPVLNCYDTKPRYQRRRCGVGLCYDIRSNSMEGRGFILVTWMGGVSMGWGACENARTYGLLLLHLIP